MPQRPVERGERLARGRSRDVDDAAAAELSRGDGGGPCEVAVCVLGDGDGVAQLELLVPAAQVSLEAVITGADDPGAVVLGHADVIDDLESGELVEPCGKRSLGHGVAAILDARARCEHEQPAACDVRRERRGNGFVHHVQRRSDDRPIAREVGAQRDHVHSGAEGAHRLVVTLQGLLVGERGVRRLDLEREARVVVVHERDLCVRPRARQRSAEQLDLGCQRADLFVAAPDAPVCLDDPVPVLLRPEARGAPAEIADLLGAARRAEDLPAERTDLLLEHPDGCVLQPAHRVGGERRRRPSPRRVEQRVVVP